MNLCDNMIEKSNLEMDYLTKEERKAFNEFYEFLQQVHQEGEYTDMHPYLDYWLENCRRILSNTVDPRGQGHE